MSYETRSRARSRWRPPLGAAVRDPIAFITLLLVLLTSLGGAQAAHAQSETVTPKGGTLSVGPSSTTVVTFYVTNSLGSDAYFNIACDGSCSTSTAYLYVPANDNRPFEVAIYAPASGSGTVTVTAANDAVGDSDVGYINYVVRSSAPSVTGDASTVSVPENRTGSVGFHVTNAGDAASSYTLSVSCSGNVSSCSVSSPTSSVNPSSSAAVTVSVHAGAAVSGNGTVVLTATSQYGETSTSTVTVAPRSLAVTVSPHSSSTTISSGAMSGLAFTVANAGNGGTVTYSLATSCTGQIVSCTAPGSVSVAQGSQATVTVQSTASSSLTGGGGSVTLTASAADGANSYSDAGTFAVTVPDARTYGVSVTPKGTAAAVDQNTSPSASFTVQNTGNVSNTFSITSSCSGTVASCSPSPSSVTIGGGLSTTVTLSYHVGSAGTAGTAGIVATAGAVTDGGSYAVSVNHVFGVVVTPSTGSATVPPSTSGTAHFTVLNQGNQAASFTLTPNCANAAFASCSISTPSSPVSIGAGASVGVDVAYVTSANDASGPLKLTAASGSATDTHEMTVVVYTPPTVSILLDSANAGAVIARDECVTVSLGSGAASECGDLRLVHALPAVRTLNKERAPVLVYTSQHAEPRPVVAADLTVPSSVALPDSVRGTVTINGTTYASAKWLGSAWGSPGASRRVALSFDASGLATGAYRYTFTATRYGQGEVALSTATGTLIVVNRAASAFGAGWWVAGWERLYAPSDTTMLWVGGDGSARLYRKTHDSVYVAAALDRSDSLAWSAGASRYIHWGANKLQVRFDASGVHRETINRLGHTTVFAGSTAQLDSIGVPTATSAKLWYRFTYTGGQLMGITAPGASGTRALVVTPTSGRVTDIAGPDTTHVQFGYATGTNRVISRTDRAANTVRYGYDALGRIVADTLAPDDTTRIVTSFRPAESQLALAGVPMIADSVSTLIAGPRGDTTRIRITRYGAPTRIQNALGQVTTLVRANASFPALVTAMTAPNGLVTRAGYDARGHIVADTVVSPYGGSNAVTRSWWNPTWDMVDSTRTPIGVMSYAAYDALGNRQWEQVGPSSGRRVTYGYDPTLGLVRTVTTPASTTPDSVFYDAVLGNVRATRSPMGVTSVAVADAIGRDTLSYLADDPLHARTRTMYDAMSRVFRTVSYGDGGTRPAFVGVAGNPPADSLVVTNQYDGEGRLTGNSRALGVNMTGYAGPTTSYGYDGIGRRTQETETGRTVFLAYDVAGNVITRTVAGQTVTMQYDILNRMVKRITPTRTYDAIPCTSLPNVPPDCYAFNAWQLPSPAYVSANSYNKAVCISADTAEFEFDPAGNMIRADNGDARVRRTYYANGQLRTDSVTIRRLYRSVADECGGVAPPPPDTTQMCGDSIHGTHPCWITLALPGVGGASDTRRRQVAPLATPERTVAAAPLPNPIAQLALADGGAHGDSGNPPFDFGASLLHAFRAARSASVGNDADFQQYVYGLTYTYYLDGTRASLSHPANLTSGSAQSYGYDTATGDLTSVTDPRGNAYSLAYDNARRLGTFTAFTGGASAATELLTYDDDSRLIRRQVSAPAVSALDSMSYDLAGRVHGATHTSNDGFVNASYTRAMYYNGLGAVVGTESTGSGGSQDEAFTVDALGNRLQSWRVSDDPNAVDPTSARVLSYQAGGPLLQIVAPNNDSTAGHYFREVHEYDGAGNEIIVATTERPDINAPTQLAQRVSFYDAAERLRVMERHLGDYSQASANTATDFGAYETYRYDALGRRVFVVSLGGGGSYTERTVWDGDQMLYQIRDAYPNTTPGTGGGTGTVGYIHGAGLDHPLAVWKPEVGTVAPFTDWRGTYALGATASGSACCAGFLWPARTQTVDHLTPPQAGLTLWLGSLLQEGKDGSGLQYKRNRYYDPQTGRFTQVDPIGLAGGLNAYGFAQGDPVNYSDPFGLCPKDAGGDGKSDSFADCQKGTSGYYANEAANGRGGAMNTAKGVIASCKENTACAAIAVAGAAVTGEIVVSEVGAALLGETAGATGEITGATKHGINRIIQRGVKPGEILDAVRNGEGIRAVDKFGRTSYRYVGEKATVILNEAGKIISAWGGGW